MEQNQNQNMGLIIDESRNHICVNCSKLLTIPYPSSLINSEDHLIQLQEKREADVEEHFTFKIEIVEDLEDHVNDLPSPANNSAKSVQRIQVHEILSSIYSLNFLHLASSSHAEANFLDDPMETNGVNSIRDLTAVNEEGMCLCSGCARVLTNLYKYYTQFNQLRAFDSILSKKIHRLNEILGKNQIYNQNQQQIRSQPQSQCESDSFTGPVVKCEVLTEGGTVAQISFEEDDDNDPFGVVRIELDENESHLRSRQFQDVEPLQPDADGDGDRTTNSDPIIVDENASAIENEVETSGPWVRLSRLRNARFLNPVHVSNSNQLNQHENGNNDERPDPDHGIQLRKRQKIRKLNFQGYNWCVEGNLISSGPSDNDNPNHSDFNVESTTLSTKRKRTPSLRSSRKLKPNKTTVTLNPIEIPTELDPEKNKDNTHSSYQSRCPSIYSSSSDSDSKPQQVIVKKAFLKRKLKKSNTKKSKTTKTAAKTIKNTRSNISQSETKLKPNEIDTTDEDDTEENTETRKNATKELTSYRRRKVRAPNPCWHCPLDFPTQKECADHTKATHFSPGDFFCSKCSKLCPNKHSYTQHLTICEKLCPGKKLAPYLCPHCGKSYPFKYYLDKHVKVHNEEGSFSCSSPDCTFKAKSQLLINLHFGRMHVEAPKFKVGKDGQLNLSEPIIHKCDLCQVTFKNDHSRRMHMYRRHTEEGLRKYRERCDAVLARQKVERSLKVKSTVCPDCNINFFSNLALIGHRKTMHNIVEAVCVCEQCGKDFLREKSLKRHMQFAHTEDRPFVCEHCGKAFKTSQNLKDHVNHTHNEEGRRKYNEFNRRRNQRKKIVAEALAKKSGVTGTST